MHGPVIFDLDGTVWDSAPGIISCIEETLDAFGLPAPDRDRLSAHLGPPLLAMLTELGVAAGDLDAARAFYRERYRLHGEFECRVYDGIGDLLIDLRDDGRSLATATSKGIEAVRRMLAHFELDHSFDVVAAASMTAVGHDKVGVVAEALAGLGLDPRPEGVASGDQAATMVGDRIFDIEAGRHHGLHTIGVTWGYAPDGELEEAACDELVTTVTGLAAALGVERRFRPTNPGK